MTLKKIAMFGGAFNPIHNGHLHLARQMQKRYQFDRILLMPSGIPPHKAAPDLADGEHRLAMCRLAVQDDPVFQASDLELRRNGKSYTVDTIETLGRQYPGVQLYLIVGSDMLLTFDRWYRFDDILSQAVLLAAARDFGEYQALCQKGRELEELVPGASVRVENFPAHPLSSTQVREIIRKGESAQGFLPPQVFDYLTKNGLYRL